MPPYSSAHYEQYLDTKQWQRVTLSHMPHWQIFDVYFLYTLSWADDIIDFITIINQFNSPFWFERQ
jgi:hypothetical protein